MPLRLLRLAHALLHPCAGWDAVWSSALGRAQLVESPEVARMPAPPASLTCCSTANGLWRRCAAGRAGAFVELYPVSAHSAGCQPALTWLPGLPPGLPSTWPADLAPVRISMGFFAFVSPMLQAGAEAVGAGLTALGAGLRPSLVQPCTLFAALTFSQVQWSS